MVDGLACDDRDAARCRIAAKQGALRSLQHFDVFDVVELGDFSTRSSGIDAVDIDADRRVGADAEIGGGDAPDGDRGCVGLLASMARPGTKAASSGHVVGGMHIDGGGIDHADRDRHVFQRLRPHLRGHDNRFAEESPSVSARAGAAMAPPARTAATASPATRGKRYLPFILM
jgi:hypothetical protein